MAARAPHEQPELGDTLLVVHEFQARSSDELTFVKGDHLELIERDDEFGDGWYLGRHLGNGNTGLFPESYTRPVPKTAAKPTPTPINPPSAPPMTTTTALPELTQDENSTVVVDAHSSSDQSSQPTHSTSTAQNATYTLPLTSLAAPVASKPESVAEALGRLNDKSQDSQVLNDTLNVINEHITNLRSPSSSNALRANTGDSESEYSVALGARMSYIQGEETDDEEDATHTSAQVMAWTPDNVAEFLFTSGVEKHHCEIFREQEISGEVLLGMDQSSLFIKDLDLGSVGRRLKTWHRIKALQDEVGGQGIATRRTTQTYGSDVGSEDAPRTRGGRASTVTTSISNPPTHRLSANQTSPSLTPASAAHSQYSPTQQSNHFKRPSAASVRDLHHSRRHSSSDQQIIGTTTPRLANNGTFPDTVQSTHKKQPSFDRNWNMGGAFSQTSPRPLSSSGPQAIVGGPETGLQDSAVDLDRGYFSNNEADGRTRTVLRKRDSVAHSRKSSYADEQRVRSATALSRHSRFGSDSYRETAQPSAAQKYYGIQSAAHRRTASTNTTDSARPLPPAKDGLPPAVTRLDTSRGSLSSSKGPPTPAKDGDWLSSLVNKPKSKTGGFGIRAISDNLGFSQSKSGTSAGESSKDQPLASPARTTSSTPSGGPSFDLDSRSTSKSNATTTTPASRNKGRKGKKETSAYTRGLLKIGPKEAMKDADYCGWMRKKSSHLMTTWKPRFFVLKGRRLSYYYSEDDTEEKGLIDISFHRVLPADNEKITGLHATITGVVGGPDSKISNFLPSTGDSEGPEKGDDAVFIFKLVPPRAGLSRAVNFTKPTVHYFAVPNLKQGRLWMAALMKATIDRDDSQPVSSTYQAKTISLAKAKQMRSRPPALMNLEEHAEEEHSGEQLKHTNGPGEADSDVITVENGGVQSPDIAKLNFENGEKLPSPPQPSA